MKLQHFHDYLEGTQLVTPDQIEVWESDSETYCTHSYDGASVIRKTRQFKINLLINNMTSSQNRDIIEFAILWWLNVYEDSHDLKKPRFTSVPDIINHRVTDLWIGFDVTETSTLKADGTVHTCNPQNVIEQGDFEPPLWVKFVDYDIEFPLDSPPVELEFDE